VYGLIFLFRYASDTNEQEASCPDNVWFANQTHEFACATVSLLNVVNNIPDADLGEHLQSFKDFTKPLTPAQRGDQIGCFEYIKQTHNSFARKMDMLNIDLGMQNAYDDRSKSKKKPAATKAKSKKGKVTTEEDYVDDENAFHFVAYVPIGDEVWKLDGLDRQPSRVGKFKGDDWLPIVVPRITERMESLSSGGIEFALISLVKDPMTVHQEDLAQNIRCLQEVQSKLSAVKPSWRDFSTDSDETECARRDSVVSGPHEGYGIRDGAIADSAIPSAIAEQLKVDCPEKLIALRQDLVTAQSGLRSMIKSEQSQAEFDQRRALERRYDYGQTIAAWLEMLAGEEGAVKDLLEETR